MYLANDPELRAALALAFGVQPSTAPLLPVPHRARLPPTPRDGPVCEVVISSASWSNLSVRRSPSTDWTCARAATATVARLLFTERCESLLQVLAIGNFRLLYGCPELPDSAFGKLQRIDDVGHLEQMIRQNPSNQFSFRVRRRLRRGVVVRLLCRSGCGIGLARYHLSSEHSRASAILLHHMCQFMRQQTLPLTRLRREFGLRQKRCLAPR